MESAPLVTLRPAKDDNLCSDFTADAACARFPWSVLEQVSILGPPVTSPFKECAVISEYLQQWIHPYSTSVVLTNQLHATLLQLASTVMVDPAGPDARLEPHVALHLGHS